MNLRLLPFSVSLILAFTTSPLLHAQNRGDHEIRGKIHQVQVEIDHLLLQLEACNKNVWNFGDIVAKLSKARTTARINDVNEARDRKYGEDIRDHRRAQADASFALQRFELEIDRRILELNQLRRKLLHPESRGHSNKAEGKYFADIKNLERETSVLISQRVEIAIKMREVKTEINRYSFAVSVNNSESLRKKNVNTLYQKRTLLNEYQRKESAIRLRINRCLLAISNLDRELDLDHFIGPRRK